MCYSLWSLICLFSHEDFDILLLVFHIPSLNSFQTQRKMSSDYKRRILFFISSEKNFARFNYLSLIHCALNNNLHLNTDLLSTNSYGKFAWMAKSYFFVLMIFFPINLEVLFYVFSSSSFPLPPSPLPPPSSPSPLFLLLLLLLHWVWETGEGFSIHTSLAIDVIRFASHKRRWNAVFSLKILKFQGKQKKKNIQDSGRNIIPKLRSHHVANWKLWNEQ